MKAGSAILAFGGLAAAFLYWDKTQVDKVIENLQYSIKSLKINKADIVNTAFQLELGLFNPNNRTLTYPDSRFVGKIIYNNREIANFNSALNLVIKGNSETVYNIGIKASNFQIANEIFDIIMGGKVKKTATIQGNINYGNVLIPVTKVIELQ